MLTGSKETKLVILRGNSASGKSAVARGIREQFGRGMAIVGQDAIRRDILKDRDRAGAANIGLIDVTVRYALDYGFHVIVEGILYSAHYGEMLRQLAADHRGMTHVYYFDVSFQETLRRHATKPQAGEYGEPEMRSWFQPHDLLCVPGIEDVLIPESMSLEYAVNSIMRDVAFPHLAHEMEGER